jgi:hypothetical protein
MASYAPPSNNLTIFNPDQFLVDSSLLEFPVAQGAETFPFGLTTSTATVVGALTVGGTSTLSTTNVSGQMTMGTANQIKTNLQEGTTASTSVLLYSENARNGSINLGTGTTGKIITIGESTASTVNLRGSTIDANKMNVSGTLTAGTFNPSSISCDTFTTTTTGTTASLFGEATRGGNINIGIGTNRTGTINIGNGGGGSATGGVSIQTNGTGTVTIGNSGSTTALVGSVDINITGTANTRIGNATGTTSFTGTVNMNDNVSLGLTSADLIVPNGTLTKPLIIGTYASQSSFSLSSITPVTTYLGGTLQTSNTFSSVASGTFVYSMSSITPYNAGGGIALTAGTYLFFMGANWEDSSAFDMTDLRMGLSDDGTLTAATLEAALLAAAPNRTCFLHKTDTATSSAGDSENRVISGCFNIASATTMYPWFKANTSIVVSSVTVDVIFTKIGSA